MSSNVGESSAMSNKDNLREVIVTGTAEAASAVTLQESNLMILNNQKLCDIVFVVGRDRVEVKCHKIFLIARSPVFMTKFSERWGEEQLCGNVTVEELPEEDPTVFRAFIEFIYGDKLSEDVTEVMKILPLADFYAVEQLLQKCEKVMANAATTIEYAFETYKASFQYNMYFLRSTAGRYIASKFVELHTHSSFENLDESTLKHILQRTDFLANEMELFQIVRRWAEIQRDKNKLENVNRSEREILKNLIPYIHFPTIPPQTFAKYVVPTNILTSEELVNIFVYMASYWTERTEIYHKIPYPKVFRGSESTIDLYHVDSNKKTQQVMDFVVSHSEHRFQQDVISFVLEFEKPRVAFPSLTITHLFLRGPVISPSSSPSSSSSLPTNAESNPINEPCAGSASKQDEVEKLEYMVDVSILISGVTKYRITTKLKAGEGHTHIIPPTARFPLNDRGQYNVCVIFNRELPFLKSSQNILDPALDTETNSSLRPLILKPNRVENFKLVNISMTTFLEGERTENNKDIKWIEVLDTPAFHTVRGLKLGFY